VGCDNSAQVASLWNNNLKGKDDQKHQCAQEGAVHVRSYSRTCNTPPGSRTRHRQPLHGKVGTIGKRKENVLYEPLAGQGTVGGQERGDDTTGQAFL
jgi:hypothetical protein